MEPESAGVRVAWSDWNAEAFARARDERKPVLLSITAPWAAACVAMDAECYADPAAAAIIAERTVAVRVDADQRPDIAERYDLGGLPSTVFLDAAGRVLGGGTFVPPARLVAAVHRLTASPETGPGPRETGPVPISDQVAHSSGVAGPQKLSVAGLTALVFEAFDEVNGGFGGAPKFPLTAPVRLALEAHLEDPDEAKLGCAARTLDAMGWGPLFDEQDGGFFRCAAGADWSRPQPEKLLAPNVALLDLYLFAGAALAQARWLERAADIVGYVNRALRAANGAWLHAERAAPGRQFTDSNGAAASAMLHAAATFDDADLGKHAIEAFERVLLATYRPGQGVAHSATGVRGLLADQVAMATASLDAWETTGNVVYRMMAEELMHYAVRTMWNEAAGLFNDRSAELAAADPVATPALQPFVANCDAARVLDRIARATAAEPFAPLSRRVLAALDAPAQRFGPLAAHYLLARRSVLR
jgi:uncharacterized protein YyaL (SSP411 family)